MEHNLFKPTDLETAKHAAVGDCNGYTMEQRYTLETPLFAEAILKHVNHHSRILDYGCGPGRLAKEILKQQPAIFIDGVDASRDMVDLSVQNVMSRNYRAMLPVEIRGKYALIYCVYVLQHAPAIEIREILNRIYDHLEDDGVFVYCSSDYRMAIRYDGGGFFDDRFLGVDLRAEVEKLFIPVEELFNEQTRQDNLILQKMIAGEPDGLAHPAIVFKKKTRKQREMIGPLEPAPQSIVNADIEGSIFTEKSDLHEAPIETFEKGSDDSHISLCTPRPMKLILVNRLAPGDCLVMTNVIRDLHLAYPGRYITAVRTPANDIFENNPYVVNFPYNEIKYKEIENSFAMESNPNGRLKQMDDILVIDMKYPLIHKSGKVGSHFAEGHREYLEGVLGVKIPQTAITPELYLTQDEKTWPIAPQYGIEGKYWVINAGSKSDYGLKQYHRYQEVVSELFGLTFVQIGQTGHKHESLTGAVDIVGQTNLRQLIRLISQAEGVLSCVSLPIHIAAAFKKPCVVVAGAREGTRWELYPNHQFLYVNGCLPCAAYDGCWRNNYNDCNNKVTNVPRCLTLITPDDIIHSIQRYYDGGMLNREGL